MILDARAHALPVLAVSSLKRACDMAMRMVPCGIILAVLCVEACGSPQDAAKPDDKAPQKQIVPISIADLVAKAEPSVALVRGRTGFGTGFLAGPGLLVTNQHVIDGEVVQDLEISFPSADAKHKGPFSAEIVYQDVGRDLAILAVKIDLPPLPLAEADTSRKGDEIVIIGNPGVGDRLVLENAVSRGIMSSKAMIDGRTYRQINASVNPGNSGGPVFDREGRVIGVATKKATQLEEMAFSIPIEDVRLALERADAESKAAKRKPGADAKVAARELAYGWKEGETYAYAVRISYDAGPELVTIDGVSLYRIKKATDKKIDISHRAHLTSRKRKRRGDGATEISYVPATPTELTIDRKGHKIASIEQPQQPDARPLGDIAALLMDPLPEKASASWTILDSVVFPEVKREAATLVAAAPPWMMPDFRLRPRIGLDRRFGEGPNFGGGPRFGPGGRMAPGGQFGPQFNPPPVVQQPAAQVTLHPCHVKEIYALASADGDGVTIRKTIEMASDESIDNEPMYAHKEEGTLALDPDGVPKTLNTEGKFVHNSDNLTVRVPMKIALRRVVGEEKARLIAHKHTNPTAMNPIARGDLEHAIRGLSGDAGSINAACAVLVDSEPVEAKRSEVARELEGILDATDPFSVASAFRALGVWGDRQTGAVLADRLKRMTDRPEPLSNEFVEAVMRLGPDKRVAQVLEGWLGIERPGRSLEASKMLVAAGTEAQLSRLRSLAARKDEADLGRAAGDSVRAISARVTDAEDLDVTIATLADADIGKVQASIRRLGAMRPIEARRDDVVNALVPMLDSSNAPDLIRALSVWGGDQARDALAAHLRPEDLAWREIIGALAKMPPNVRSAEAVAARLSNDHKLVIDTLRSMGPAAEPSLIRMLDHPDLNLRGEVYEAIAAAGTLEGAKALEAFADRKTNNSFQKLSAEDARKAAAKIRDRFPNDPEASLRKLIVEIKVTDPNRRNVAIERLIAKPPIEAKRAEVSRILETFIVRGDPFFQGPILRALAVWGDDAARRTLIKIVEDREYAKWDEAIDALASVATDEVPIQAIALRLKQDRGRVYIAMRKLRPDKLEPVLQQFARESPDVLLRTEACRALGEFGGASNLEFLTEVAKLEARAIASSWVICDNCDA